MICTTSHAKHGKQLLSLQDKDAKALMQDLDAESWSERQKAEAELLSSKLSIEEIRELGVIAGLGSTSDIRYRARRILLKKVSELYQSQIAEDTLRISIGDVLDNDRFDSPRAKNQYRERIYTVIDRLFSSSLMEINKIIEKIDDNQLSPGGPFGDIGQRWIDLYGELLCAPSIDETEKDRVTKLFDEFIAFVIEVNHEVDQLNLDFSATPDEISTFIKNKITSFQSYHFRVLFFEHEDHQALLKDTRDFLKAIESISNHRPEALFETFPNAGLELRDQSMTRFSMLLIVLFLDKSKDSATELLTTQQKILREKFSAALSTNDTQELDNLIHIAERFFIIERSASVVLFDQNSEQLDPLSTKLIINAADAIYNDEFHAYHNLLRQCASKIYDKENINVQNEVEHILRQTAGSPLHTDSQKAAQSILDDH